MTLQKHEPEDPDGTGKALFAACETTEMVLVQPLNIKGWMFKSSANKYYREASRQNRLSMKIPCSTPTSSPMSVLTKSSSHTLPGSGTAWETGATSRPYPEPQISMLEDRDAQILDLKADASQTVTLDLSEALSEHV
ncbi:hypothetical protein SARC_05859 [Sphaeroforma arctica JP610]|uniref:Uncharacterized protein n=1 Tax=Sphaeroforma arctica JP610 TaxID=667725 RepID=A0A0L0FYY3_9EUKA|nr:hypothetical protein SARC_05859 [Sphaeroforma arctica JP610]KNC81839.1 hypothetical protein SARC_05859 [Sphaeroforma arctica JP610]|eukprot:XP_014155741.1 hypothetical protein SARC_05859 [Sphaeroforma arctica JP610]